MTYLPEWKIYLWKKLLLNYAGEFDRVLTPRDFRFFTEDELAEINARTHTNIVLFEEKLSEKQEETTRKKEMIRMQRKYLHDNKLKLLMAGTYSYETYMAEENRLNDKLKKFNIEESASDAALHEVIKDVVKLSELLKNASAYWSFANSAEREQIMRVIFSELLLSENTLQFKVKKGFKPFETRLLVVGNPTGSRSGVLACWLGSRPGLTHLCSFRLSTPGASLCGQK